MKTIFKGLAKTRRALRENLSGLLRRAPGLSPEFWEGWEAALIGVDVGVRQAIELTERVKTRAEEERVEEPDAVTELFRAVLLKMLQPLSGGESSETPAPPVVTMIVGVNGSGKTTAAAKLARYRQKQGEKVILAACDTFRAAAIEQLGIWADRLGVEMVRQKYGADAAAVAFDAYSAARSRGADRLIIDTAGRLHTRSNLMEELKKIARALGKSEPSAPHEVLLALDAVVGQNGLVQARSFLEAVGLTGVILNKLDGTARGGIVLAVRRELEVPVLFVGTGEDADDLAEFDPAAFVDALLNDSSRTEESESSLSS